ncbi:hypothetical protein E2C01_071585 [Portunus trituberculatus]|uniref:Uncharacterized protein n=1 Tax=Portunus trituberculatus TaxID=210409 RepID=A0A5B7I5I0_PORTR|nr:hypothetical protein [Portunus trituberculatus]
MDSFKPAKCGNWACEHGVFCLHLESANKAIFGDGISHYQARKSSYVELIVLRRPRFVSDFFGVWTYTVSSSSSRSHNMPSVRLVGNLSSIRIFFTPTAFFDCGTSLRTLFWLHDHLMSLNPPLCNNHLNL